MTLPCVLESETRNGRSFDALSSWIERESATIQERLWQHGALLFRGFELLGAEQLAKIARIIAPDLLHYLGGDAPRDSVGLAIYTSTTLPASQPIPLHNEKSYSNDHPAMVFFLCDRVPTKGGDTPLLDGRLLLSTLDPRLVETFQRKQIRYIQNLPDRNGSGKSWQQTFESEDPSRAEQFLRDLRATFWWKPDGTLHVEEVVQPVVQHPRTGDRAFFSQVHRWHLSDLSGAVHGIITAPRLPRDRYHSCTFADGSEISAEMIDQIRSMMQQNAVRFSWRRGDLLLLENLLTLHGRDPYCGRRRILVAMA